MKGSCFCGAISYQIAAKPTGTTLCHCEDCRKASGAPVVAWTFFPAGSIVFSGQMPRTIMFAERERTFCPHCGSQLMFFDPALPHQFEVTTCTLELAAEILPSDHNWVGDRLPWFETTDLLPRHPKNTPAPDM
jgi:hypothetical protein